MRVNNILWKNCNEYLESCFDENTGYNESIYKLVYSCVSLYNYSLTNEQLELLKKIFSFAEDKEEEHYIAYAEYIVSTIITIGEANYNRRNYVGNRHAT